MVKSSLHKARKRKDLSRFALLIALVFVLNVIGFYFFKRFDLTSEKRYTLAPSTVEMLKNLDDEVYLKVYLQGDFNPSFTRLRNEARELLDEFRAYAKSNLHYEFINPTENVDKKTTSEL